MNIERWEIDSSRSRIRFAVRHLVFSKTRGRFTRWSGTVMVPDGDFSRATADVLIDASSIDTGVPKRDAHLRTADYFGVERHPSITFTTSHVRAEPDGHLRVTGALTIRGVSREVMLVVEPNGYTRDSLENDRARFAAKAAIERRDFEFTGIPALDAGGLVIGARIDIVIEVEAVKGSVARAA
jgi:polyisoprenoid-binding protein YceI